MEKKFSLCDKSNAFKKLLDAESDYKYWKNKWDEIIADHRDHMEVIYRVSSKYIKFNACGYERMLKIKSYKFDKNEKNAFITCDSVEIITEIDGNKCRIKDDITIKIPTTDIKFWNYEIGFHTYDDSDWRSFVMRALRTMKSVKDASPWSLLYEESV